MKREHRKKGAKFTARELKALGANPELARRRVRTPERRPPFLSSASNNDQATRGERHD